MSCVFKHFVQGRLHFFPYSIAVGFNNHTTPDCGILCKTCFNYEVIIPLGVILFFIDYLLPPLELDPLDDDELPLEYPAPLEELLLEDDPLLYEEDELLLPLL